MPRERSELEGIAPVAAGIAHDFNNLLGVILNSAHFVAEDLPPESPAHKDLEEIRLAAQRAASLTRQLLLVSRQATGTRERDEHVSEAEAVPRDDASPTPSVTGETVLVVEDEDAARRLAERILSGAGYDVLSASCGAEALEVAGHIDLLLSDIAMPGMLGPELADRLLERQPSIKVLFVSGQDASTLQRLGHGGQAIGYLPKPFTPAALLRSVRAVLDGDDAARNAQ